MSARSPPSQNSVTVQTNPFFVLNVSRILTMFGWISFASILPSQYAYWISSGVISVKSYFLITAYALSDLHYTSDRRPSGSRFFFVL